MDLTADHRSQRFVDQTMALDERAAVKPLGDDQHREVSAARGRTGMTDVLVAVVAQFEV